MPDEPTAGTVFVLETDEVARNVLTVLLDRHPALVSLEEIVRHFAFPPATAISEMFIREGVDDLARYGLAHTLDRFAFATHTAVRANELGG